MELLQLGFNVSASSSDASHPPYYALDNSATTYFTNNGGGWWQVELDANLPILQITLRTLNNSSATAGYYTFIGSNDAINYKQIGILEIPFAGGVSNYTISFQYAPRCKYIKVYPSDENGVLNNTTMRIYNFQVTRWYSASSYNKYTLSNYIPSLDKGQVAKFLVPSTYAGGNIQLNINSLGYKNVNIPPDVFITPNKPLSIWYDGTNFQYEFAE